MSSEKNITMRQYNGVDYDTLYPKTKVEQVKGAYTQQQILSDSTKGLFGLGADAVPDDAFVALKNMVYGLTPEKIGAAKFASGSYVGTGLVGSSNKNSLTFPFEPIAVVVMSETQDTPDAYDRTIDGGWVWLRGVQVGYSAAYFYANSTTAATVLLTWSGNKVSWYVSQAYIGNIGQPRCQLNYKGYKYRYIAIG